jgi:transcriptional regulator with XRE-family HTH domain
LPVAPPSTDTALRLVVARNVKSARARAGLSQRELCALTKISQSYLSQVETGSWNMGIDNIAKIARALGVLPHDLLNPRFTADQSSGRD